LLHLLWRVACVVGMSMREGQVVCCGTFVRSGIGVVYGVGSCYGVRIAALCGTLLTWRWPITAETCHHHRSNKLYYLESCVLTDLPTIICIKHNGDDKPEAGFCILKPDTNVCKVNFIKIRQRCGHMQMKTGINYTNRHNFLYDSFSVIRDTAYFKVS
jgi:nitrite reductase/ring-hydroxylating ferredoxin subunit